jgi:hypothetical protein
VQVFSLKKALLTAKGAEGNPAKHFGKRNPSAGDQSLSFGSALPTSALPGSDREEGFGFLFDVVAAAVRASNLIFLVLVESENFFKFLVAVVAEVVVHGHGRPPAESALFERNCMPLFGMEM